MKSFSGQALICLVAAGIGWLLLLSPGTASGEEPHKCALPTSLQRQVAKIYPNTRMVALSDLESHDRELFLNEHDDACPGIVAIDFFGAGEKTLAVVLINTKGAPTARLLVAREVRNDWVLKQLDTAKSRAVVVWKQDAGNYSDVYKKREIHSKTPVLVFCQYEAWAILYAWNGKTVSKIWLSD